MTTNMLASVTARGLRGCVSFRPVVLARILGISPIAMSLSGVGNTLPGAVSGRRRAALCSREALARPDRARALRRGPEVRFGGPLDRPAGTLQAPDLEGRDRVRARPVRGDGRRAREHDGDQRRE